MGYISTEPKGTLINGYPVLCTLDEYINNHKNYDIESLIISIGDNFIRKQIASILEIISLNFINAIHPKSIVSSRSQFVKGVLVNEGAIINLGTIIGGYSNARTNSYIDHDYKMEKFVN